MTISKCIHLSYVAEVMVWFGWYRKVTQVKKTELVNKVLWLAANQCPICCKYQYYTCVTALWD